MPLSKEQAQNLAKGRFAIRAAPDAHSVAGAGYGLYTARTMEEMKDWLLKGPPPAWCDQLYNTGLFILGMPAAEDEVLLFVPGGGDPQGESYKVDTPLARGDRRTLPKVNRLAADARPSAVMALRGATAQSIHDWVIAQIPGAKAK